MKIWCTPSHITGPNNTTISPSKNNNIYKQGRNLTAVPYKHIQPKFLNLIILQRCPLFVHKRLQSDKIFHLKRPALNWVESRPYLFASKWKNSIHNRHSECFSTKICLWDVLSNWWHISNAAEGNTERREITSKVMWWRLWSCSFPVYKKSELHFLPLITF